MDQNVPGNVFIISRAASRHTAYSGRHNDVMTIKDIARQCSVSVQHRFRVLNATGRTSAMMCTAGTVSYQASNYIPNNSARDLVRAKSDAIGLIVRGVSSPLYTDIIRTIKHHHRRRPYHGHAADRHL